MIDLTGLTILLCTFTFTKNYIKLQTVDLFTEAKQRTVINEMINFELSHQGSRDAACCIHACSHIAGRAAQGTARPAIWLHPCNAATRPV